MKKIELIELGLHEVLRQCHVIDGVMTECIHGSNIQEAKGIGRDRFLDKLVYNHQELLDEVHTKVIELLDLCGEYMNNSGMTDGVEAAISKVVYDLVYERKTEKDYE